MQKAFTKITWIRSNGGPLLLLSPIYMSAWKGTSPSETERTVVSNKIISDYDRACRVRSYIEPLQVANGKALVLNEGQLMATWWSQTKNISVLVRLDYVAESIDIDHEAFLKEYADCPDDQWQSDQLTLDVPDAYLCLFDSAYPGSDFENMPKAVKMVLPIQIGQYSIATAEYKPTREVGLVLHRFVKIS